jgi:prepilin-type processing-associated H-X9-DG protein
MELYACPKHAIDNPQIVRSYAMYNPNASDAAERQAWQVLCADRSFEPSETVMFAEVNETRLSDVQSGCQFWSINHVEFRHSESTANIVFFDGHMHRGTRAELDPFFNP